MSTVSAKTNTVIWIIMTPILLAVGFILLRMVFNEWSLYRRSATWTPIPAAIESVEFTPAKRRGASLKCDYVYTVNDKQYHGTRVGILTVTEAWRWANDRFKTLDKCRESRTPFTAMVNPLDPNDSLLFRDDYDGLQPFVFLALGLSFGLMPFLWWGLYVRRALQQGSQYSTG